MGVRIRHLETCCSIIGGRGNGLVEMEPSSKKVSLYPCLYRNGLEPNDKLCSHINGKQMGRNVGNSRHRKLEDDPLFEVQGACFNSVINSLWCPIK